MVKSQPRRVDQGALERVLSELQRQHGRHLSALEVLDGKAIQLVGWASISISVVSALRIDDMVASGGPAPLILFSATAIIYVVVVALALSAFFPRDYALPVGLDEDEIVQLYLSSDEQAAIEQLLVQYVTVIRRNRRKEGRRSKVLCVGFALLPLLVIALLATLTWPLW